MNTTWKYGTGNSSLSRAAVQAALDGAGQQSDADSVSSAASVVLAVMPDFEVFNKTLEAVHGLPSAGYDVAMAVAYAIGYTVATLTLGSMIFARRDFK